ncbi:MAG: hypothetical protein ABIK18_06530, partial [candidate division WOR-3 bacterium]
NIYNISGKEIKRFTLPPQVSNGATPHWERKDDEGEAVPAGVYCIKLVSRNIELSEKIVLIE